MSFIAQHVSRSQARRLGELSPGLCTSLDKSQAILLPYAPIQVRRSLEYATPQLYLPPSSQNGAQFYLCQMVILGRKNYKSLTLKILLNPAQVLPSSSRFSRWAGVGSIPVLPRPGRGSEDAFEHAVVIN